MELFKRAAPDGTGQSAALNHPSLPHPGYSTAGSFSNRNKSTIRRKANVSHTLLVCWHQSRQPEKLREESKNFSFFSGAECKQESQHQKKKQQRDVLTCSFRGSWLLCSGRAIVASLHKCLHLNWPWRRADQTANLKQVILSISNPLRILNRFLCQFLS